MAPSSEMRTAFLELQKKLTELDKLYAPIFDKMAKPRPHITDYFVVTFNETETGYLANVRRYDFPELTEECLTLYNRYFPRI